MMKMRNSFSHYCIGDIHYPILGSAERDAFRTKDDKRVSEHAWAVYDYIRTIPTGKVTTYKVPLP